MHLSFDPLWKQLIDKKLKKTDLIAMAGISSSTLAKLSKNLNVDLMVLLKIAKVLNCNIEEIVVFKED